MAFGGGGGGPIASAFVEVLADTSRADREVEALMRRLRGLDASVDVQVDAQDVTRAVEGAVEAADTNVEVTGDATDVTGDVSDAVEAADSEVTVTADTSSIAPSIDDAIRQSGGGAPARGASVGGEFARSFSQSVTRAIAALPDITVGADTTDAERQILGIRTSLQRLASQRVGVDIDADEAARQLRDLQGQLDRIGREESSPAVSVDIAAASAQLSRFSEQLDRVDNQRVGPSADASGLRDAEDAAVDLDSALIASSRSGLQLRSILQLGAFGAAAGGLQQVVNAASDLEQAVGGTVAVFGPAERGVSSFARTADESAGLTEEAARTLTSQLGGLLQGMGFAESESAELSITLAQLGADLAATFGGTSQEAVQALGAAIRGETDPIERYGIALNQTAVGAKAVELGLAESAQEMDLNARAQATLAILTERSANAQGQFAREVDTTAGQVERARAELGNAAAEIGERLQPSVNDLIAIGRRELIPMLAESGGELADLTGAVIGLVGPLVQGAAPALGSTATILGALTPVAEALGTVLEAIPTPVLTFATALYAGHRAMRLFSGGSGALRTVLQRLPFAAAERSAATFAVGMDGVATKTGRGSRAISGLRGAIGPATLATAAFAGGLLFLDARQQAAQEHAEDLSEAVAAIRRETEQTGSSVRGFAQGLETAAAQGNETGERFTEFADTVGLSTERLSAIIQRSGSASEALDQIASSGNNAQDLVREFDGSMSAADATLRQLGSDLDEVVDELISTAVANGQLTAAQAEEVRASENQLGTMNRLIQANQRAEAASRRRSEAQLAAIEAQGLLTETEINEIRTVEDLAAREQALAEALRQRQTATQFGADLLERFAAASGRAAGQNNAFALTTISLQRSQRGINDNLSRFAQLAGGGAIAANDLEGAAAALGVPMQDLQFFIDNANQHINNFVSAASGNLPTVGTVVQNLDDNFSLGNLRDQLHLSLTAAQDFTSNIQFLVDQGLTGAASAAAQGGPGVAAALVQGFRDGDRDIVEQINLLSAGLEQQVGVVIPQKLQGLAPQVASGMGLIGLEANRAFGGAFNPSDPAAVELQATIAEMQGQSGIFGVAGDILASSFTGGFDTNLRPTTEHARVRSERTLDTLASHAPRYGDTGQTLGGRTTTGFGSSMSFMPSTGSRHTSRAQRAIAGFERLFGTTGGKLGSTQVGGYDTQASRMRTQAQQRAEQARRNVSGFATSFRSSGSSLGTNQVSGYDLRARGMAGAGARNAKTAWQRIASFGGQFRSTGSGLGSSAAGGIRSGMAQGVAPGVFDPFVRSKIKSNVEASFKRVFGIFSPARTMIPIGQNILRGVMVGISNETGSLDRLIQNIPGLFNSLVGLVGPGPGGGVKRWASVALAALKYTGQSASWLNDLLTQMQHESGGNPNAINLWDINARNGVPSQGLMQTIPPTFMTYARELAGRGIRDPFANIVAAIRYTLARYGDLGAWRRRGFKGYEHGTGYVERTGPAFVHRGEGILPARVNAFLKRAGYPVAQPPPAVAAGPGIVIEQFIVNVPAGTPNPTIYGSRVRKGFERSVRERQIQVDARIS